MCYNLHFAVFMFDCGILSLCKYLQLKNVSDICDTCE